MIRKRKLHARLIRAPRIFVTHYRSMRRRGVGWKEAAKVAFEFAMMLTKA